jgi:hypothetical protein
MALVYGTVRTTNYVEAPQVIISPDSLITSRILGLMVNKLPPGVVPTLQSDMVSSNAADIADMFVPELRAPQLEAVLAKVELDRQSVTTHRIDHLQHDDMDKYMEEYSQNLTMAAVENKVEMMRRAGYSESEAIEAIKTIRAKKAIEIAARRAPYNHTDDIIKSIRRSE